jgi:thiol:disulfide interchange protein
MSRYTQIAVVLVCFIFAAACGGSRGEPGTDTDKSGSTESTAGDINFIGGGTQAPQPRVEDRPYDSPFISDTQIPSTLNWQASVDQAVRTAGGDNKYKIILWFRSDECIECLQIEREIFTDNDVLANSRKWLFVKVDTKVTPEAGEYYLHGADPPALVFLDKQGNEYNRHYGAFTKDEFVTMLRTWR